MLNLNAIFMPTIKKGDKAILTGKQVIKPIEVKVESILGSTARVSFSDADSEGIFVDVADLTLNINIAL